MLFVKRLHGTREYVLCYYHNGKTRRNNDGIITYETRAEAETARKKIERETQGFQSNSRDWMR